MTSLEAAVFSSLAPHRWLTASGWSVRSVKRPVQPRRWEVFRGQLVSPDLTRVEENIASWELFLDSPEGESAGPTLAVRWLVDAGAVAVTRGFAVHGVVTRADGNVITTEPAIRWTEELIARHTLGSAPKEELALWLQRSLFLAVVGTSRLAITSTESPLPAWSFGQLHYLLAPWRSPEGWWTLAPERWQERARLAACDFELRRTAPQDMPALANQIVDAALSTGHEPDLAATVKGLFGQLSLTPAHHLLSNVMTLLSTWRERTPNPAVWTNLMADMVRQLGRHLTAFDLRRFHNQGANFPDALLLDGFVKLLLPWCAEPDVSAILFTACRLRRELEGLPVPDEPTSPGDLLRVKPGPTPAQLERQVVDPAARQRRLFADQPLTELLSRQLLARWRELPINGQELGLALFLDRPLGVPKVAQRVAIDRTPLVSYLAFSRGLAEQRLHALLEWSWLAAERVAELRAALAQMPVLGIPVNDLPLPQARPGVVCLEDARRAAPDFIVLAITARGRAELLEGARCDQPGADHWLAWLRSPACRLLIRSPRSRLEVEPRAFLTAYDGQLRPRLELALPAPLEEVRYSESPGREDLAAGLLLLGAWDETGRPQALPEPAPRLLWASCTDGSSLG